MKPVFALAVSALALVGAAPPPQDVPQTIPGLGNFSLPSGRPTASPTPAPTPTPTPEAVPIPAAPVIRLPRVTPTPAPAARQTPVPRAIPVPRASPTPTATSPDVPTPAPVSTPVAAPVAPAATPVATAPAEPPARQGSWPIGWILAALAAALAAVIGFVALRRRSADRVVADDVPAEPTLTDDAVPAGAVPVPMPSAPAAPRFLSPAAPAPAVSVPRARIELALSPRRAGLNMITATADVDVIVRNTGDVAARGIRIDVRLLSARATQDGELAELFAAPIGRPVTGAFDLAPGAERTVRALATAMRESINVLTAAGRPMFVPIVAVNVLYDRGDGQGGQTAQAFAVGIERAGSDKLAPFWLDQPTAMHDALGQRPHAPPLTR